MGREFFIILLFEKHIFNRFFIHGFLKGGRVGAAFSNTPQMCGRGLLRSRFGGWAETQRWGGTRGICRVVGWGMRFRTPPKCADAVYCVRALGGGRKRRGGEEHGVFVGWSGGGCVFERPPKC